MAAACRLAGPFVWDAFLAALDRSAAVRCWAAECACLASAACEAAEEPYSFQGPVDGVRPFRREASLGPRAVSASISSLGTLARPFTGLAFSRRREIDAGAARLGKPNGDGLLGRLC